MNIKHSDIMTVDHFFVSILIKLPSQHPFKPSIGHRQQTLIQVSIPFSFVLHFSAFTFTRWVHMVLLSLTNRETRGLAAWQLCPNLIGSNIIQPNKHEIQNLLDAKVLWMECQQQKLNSVPNFKHYQSLVCQKSQNSQQQTCNLLHSKFQLNWFLRSITVHLKKAIHSL